MISLSHFLLKIFGQKHTSKQTNNILIMSACPLLSLLTELSVRLSLSQVSCCCVSCVSLGWFRSVSGSADWGPCVCSEL